MRAISSAVIADLASALADTPLSRFARGEAYLIAAPLHVLGVALIVGPVLLADLRVLGLFRALPFAATLHAVGRLAQTGFVIATVSGGLLFAAKPEELAANPVFAVKLAVMVIALVNALIFLRLSRHALASAAGLHVSASVSMVCWTVVIVAGALVPYAT